MGLYRRRRDRWEPSLRHRTSLTEVFVCTAIVGIMGVIGYQAYTGDMFGYTPDESARIRRDFESCGQNIKDLQSFLFNRNYRAFAQHYDETVIVCNRTGDYDYINDVTELGRRARLVHQ